jgi:hypothetical protein
VLLASETPDDTLHVLVELAQGAPVGSHGESIGVRYPLPLKAHRVLRQRVDPVRRMGLTRLHGSSENLMNRVQARAG